MIFFFLKLLLMCSVIRRNYWVVEWFGLKPNWQYGIASVAFKWLLSLEWIIFFNIFDTDDTDVFNTFPIFRSLPVANHVNSYQWINLYDKLVDNNITLEIINKICTYYNVIRIMYSDYSVCVCVRFVPMHIFYLLGRYV